MLLLQAAPGDVCPRTSIGDQDKWAAATTGPTPSSAAATFAAFAAEAAQQDDVRAAAALAAATGHSGTHSALRSAADADLRDAGSSKASAASAAFTAAAAAAAVAAVGAGKPDSPSAEGSAAKGGARKRVSAASQGKQVIHAAARVLAATWHTSMRQAATPQYLPALDASSVAEGAWRPVVQ